MEQDNTNSRLAVGTILHGAFRIDRYLSAGGFGNTYLATNVNFNETVAIKEFFMKGINQRSGDSVEVSVSNTDNLHTFESQKRKFKKEAQRLHTLHNPHIVHVHDLFEENGTIYYVMDYIDGVSLREVMKKNGHPMPEKQALDILCQVLDALDTVHKMQIYHLDLKPANIMLDKHNVAILIDFGASKQLSSDESASTSTGIAYTEGYAPTEQIEKNFEKIGPWTDFYALGATLYNLLSNEKPPKSSDVIDDESPDKHVALPMPSSVSPQMHHLVLWMMQGKRSNRPQSVEEIKDYIDTNFHKKEKPVEEEEKPVEEPPKTDPKEEEATMIGAAPESDKNTQETRQEKPKAEAPGAGQAASASGMEKPLPNLRWTGWLLIALVGLFFYIGDSLPLGAFYAGVAAVALGTFQLIVAAIRKTSKGQSIVMLIAGIALIIAGLLLPLPEP